MASLVTPPCIHRRTAERSARRLLMSAAPLGLDHGQLRLDVPDGLGQDVEVVRFSPRGSGRPGAGGLLSAGRSPWSSRTSLCWVSGTSPATAASGEARRDVSPVLTIRRPASHPRVAVPGDGMRAIGSAEIPDQGDGSRISDRAPRSDTTTHVTVKNAGPSQLLARQTEQFIGAIDHAAPDPFRGDAKRLPRQAARVRAGPVAGIGERGP